MTDNVIHLGEKEDKPPLTVIPENYQECQHNHYEVHKDLQQVFCRDCDVLLDPFWVLRRIASSHSQRHYHVQELKRESAKMEKLVKRQQETRKSQKLAEQDARAIDRHQKTQAAPSSAFMADISIKDDQE